jgi:hypothetical protein
MSGDPVPGIDWKRQAPEITGSANRASKSAVTIRPARLDIGIQRQ